MTFKVNYRDTGGKCWTRGQKFEDLCLEVFQQRGIKTRPSNEQEDTYLHADFFAYSEKWGRWVSVDAKAMRAVQRGQPLQDEFIFVEWKNTTGKPGWLIGGADVLVFERKTDLVVVNRSTVLDTARELVNRKKRVDYANKSLYAVYTRYGRKDEISMIRISDIPEDMISVWPKT